MFQFDNHLVPDVHTPPPGPKAQALLERDEQYVSPSYTRVYPLVVSRGSGAVIEDVDGNLYLDCTAGIAVTATGHCHPEVVAAIQDQANKLLHMSGTDFYYAPQIDLAQRLGELGPGAGKRRVFFTNSGAEALEAALKLARWHTGRSRAIAFFERFTGVRTVRCRCPGQSWCIGVVFRLLCRTSTTPPTREVARPAALPDAECVCVRQIEETLFKRVAPPDEVAAIFVEPIQGEGGYHVPPAGFLPALRELCDKYGILLVLDEVQCGMGRTGKMYACQHWGVDPDILCLAKGIASGMPLGAIVARDRVMNWPSGSHASTFGGNPVSCRAALATLDLLERGYMDNATERGLQLKQGLRALKKRHATIGDVRGLGLMVAVDVTKEDGRTIDPVGRDAIVQSAFQHGLLLLGCGDGAIRFCPPLCITAEQIDAALRILDEVLITRRPQIAVGA